MFGSARQQRSAPGAAARQRSAPARPARAASSAQSEPPVEGYLTDGRRLYWVLASPSWSKRVSFTLLEDCSTLEVYVLTATEVASLGMRRVEPRAEG